MITELEASSIDPSCLSRSGGTETLTFDALEVTGSCEVGLPVADMIGTGKDGTVGNGIDRTLVYDEVVHLPRCLHYRTISLRPCREHVGTQGDSDLDRYVLTTRLVKKRITKWMRAAGYKR